MATTEATPGIPNTATTAPVNRLTGIEYPINPKSKCTPNNNKTENPIRNKKIDNPSIMFEKDFLNISNNNSTSEHTMITTFMKHLSSIK